MNQAQAERQTGTVKWFNSTKGYGFIEAQSGDIFVHQSAIVSDGYRALAEGQQVTFELKNENGKVSAANVTGPNGEKIVAPPRQYQRQGRPGQQRGGYQAGM